MKKISIILLFICFLFSCTNQKQPIATLPIALQKNDKNANAMLQKYPDSSVLVLKVARKSVMPKVIIINSDLDKIPVYKLQKTDSVFLAGSMLRDLASRNPVTPTISKTMLLLGLLVLGVLLLFFILRKQKQSIIEKQLAPDVELQQQKAARRLKLFDKLLVPTNNSTTTEVPAGANIDLYAKLVVYYQDEKPYLNSNLKAVEVAKAVNISPRTITAIVKENGFNGFNNFNNKYRVEEVIRQFEDPSYNSLKTEAISSKAGFGNRQTFYTAFEEFTGFNPGFYRSELLTQ
jgi:AraC-like DNA-binding protein